MEGKEGRKEGLTGGEGAGGMDDLSLPHFDQDPSEANAFFRQLFKTSPKPQRGQFRRRFTVTISVANGPIAQHVPPSRTIVESTATSCKSASALEYIKDSCKVGLGKKRAAFHELHISGRGPYSLCSWLSA